MRTAKAHCDITRILALPATALGSEDVATLAGFYRSNQLGFDARRLAEAVFRNLIRDGEVTLRGVLAEHLKHAAALPHDIALALASDEDLVALPILATSPALTQGDLIGLLRAARADNQIAIAGRSDVSEDLSDALAMAGHFRAVVRLMQNDRAKIPEATLSHCLDRFGNSQEVRDAMAKRHHLSPGMVCRISPLLSDTARCRLIARHGVPAEMAGGSVGLSGQRPSWWTQHMTGHFR